MAGKIERNIGNLHAQDSGLLVGYRNPVTDALKRTIDASTNGAYLDLSAEWSGSTTQQRFDSTDESGLLYDQVHPGSSGHGYWAQYIAQALLMSASGVRAG